MDIALQIIDKPATHVLPFEQDAVRLRKGDIVGVHLAIDIATLSEGDYIPDEPIGSPRCGFVFVKGAPDVAWNRIQKLKNAEIDAGVFKLKRKYRVQVADIPIAVRNRFISDRYITFTWTQVKNFIKRTYTNTVITDGDL